MVYFTDNIFIQKWSGTLSSTRQSPSVETGAFSWRVGGDKFCLRFFYSTRVLPMRLATVSTQVPVQLKDFALWRTGRKALPAIGGPANTAAPSRKSKSPNAEDNFSNPTMSVRTTDCNAMMNPGKKRLRFGTEIHSKKQIDWTKGRNRIKQPNKKQARGRPKMTSASDIRPSGPSPYLSATRPKGSHALGFEPRPPILGRQLFSTPSPLPLADVIFGWPLLVIPPENP